MIVYRKKTAYNDITVTRDGTTVTLWSPDGVRQTAIDEKQPGLPSLEYAVNTSLALAFTGHLERALILGLGGGAIPVMFRQLVPGMHIDVIEIDPEICEVAATYFNFQPERSLSLIISDATDYLAEVTESYDIIVLDAYVGSEIPSSLTDQEAFRHIHRALNDSGVFVANLWSNKKPHLEKVLHSMRTLFCDLRLLHGKRSQNVLAFAAKAPITDTVVQGRSQQLQHAFGHCIPLTSLARQLR